MFGPVPISRSRIQPGEIQVEDIIVGQYTNSILKGPVPSFICWSSQPSGNATARRQLARGHILTVGALDESSNCGLSDGRLNPTDWSRRPSRNFRMDSLANATLRFQWSPVVSAGLRRDSNPVTSSVPNYSGKNDWLQSGMLNPGLCEIQ